MSISPPLKGGARGGFSPRQSPQANHSQNPCRHAVQVGQSIVVGNTKHGQTKFSQKLRTLPVVLSRIIVTFSVEFHHQALVSAIEIDDVRLDRMLAAKLQSV
jgi:hypothetical protein